MSERFKNKVNKILCKVWNDGKFDGIDEVYSENFVLHRQPLPDINGLHDLKEYISKFRTAFPGLKITYDEMFFSETALIANQTLRIRKSNSDAFHFLSTMNDVEIEGCLVTNLRDGKLLEAWLYISSQAYNILEKEYLTENDEIYKKAEINLFTVM